MPEPSPPAITNRLNQDLQDLRINMIASASASAKSNCQLSIAN
jgi:hypothetical protein